MNALKLALFGSVAIHAFTDQGVAQADGQADAIATIKKLGGRVRSSQATPTDIGIEFHLRGRELTDADLGVVARAGNIVLLNLRGTKITNKGLATVGTLTKLRELHLEQTAIDDDGLRHLAALKRLKYLNLFGTKVTDAGLKHLTGLTSLRELYVWQTQVSRAGADELRKSLPKVDVILGVDMSKISVTKPAPPKKPESLQWITKNVEAAPESEFGKSTRVTFENKRRQPVKVYWIGYDGVRKLYHTLPPNDKRDQNTYAKATWLITGANDQPLGYFITGVPESVAVIPAK